MVNKNRARARVCVFVNVCVCVDAIASQNPGHSTYSRKRSVLLDFISVPFIKSFHLPFIRCKTEKSSVCNCVKSDIYPFNLKSINHFNFLLITLLLLVLYIYIFFYWLRSMANKDTATCIDFIQITYYITIIFYTHIKDVRLERSC